MQVIYGFLQIISATIVIVILFQIFRRKFLDTQNEKISLQVVFKKIILITIQASLFWVLWFFIVDLVGFAEWVYIHHSLDFMQFYRHGGMEGSLGWGIFSVLISFPLAFFIVRKLNIKL